MIKLAVLTYETLMQMDAYIMQQESERTPDDQAKMREIGRMQHMLYSDNMAFITPARRLTEVKAHLRDSDCETVLSNHSDGIFMQLVNALRAFLFGWKSPEQTMLDSFRTTLSSMKETHPRPAVSVEAGVQGNEEPSSIPVDNSPPLVVGGGPVVRQPADDIENQHENPVSVFSL